MRRGLKAKEMDIAIPTTSQRWRNKPFNFFFREATSCRIVQKEK